MSFAEKMAAIGPRYLARSWQRVTDLAPTLEAIADGGGDEMLRELRLVFHDIAGTAGSIGYDDIGRVARLADDVLRARQQVGGPMPEDEARRLRELAAQLERMLAKARTA